MVGTRVWITISALAVAGMLAAFARAGTVASVRAGTAASVRAGTAMSVRANAVEVHERFTPDRLGAPTNLSLTARFFSPAGSIPEPVRKLTIYAPAGMAIDAGGAGTCARAMLERSGPAACPSDSRAGFGGGVGVLRLSSETIHESFTLDFFFASISPRHLSLLVYASALSPVNVELVVVAREVNAPRPYGLGFSIEIPPIDTLPGAAPASIESVFATLGAANVAYYKRMRGHHRLVHVPGLLVPRSCPPGGFPARATIELLGGRVLTFDPTVPCPAR